MLVVVACLGFVVGGFAASDLTAAVVASPDCPDVRAWPETIRLTRVSFKARHEFERGNVMVEFRGPDFSRDTLPAAMGSQGPIAYTLWLGCTINGKVLILPVVECIRTYVPTGNIFMPNQLRKNLFYYAAEPLRSHQPVRSESMIAFVTTGDTRRQNVQAPGISAARSNVVNVRFEVGEFVPIVETVKSRGPPGPPLEPRAAAVIDSMYEKFKSLAHGTDDQRRELTRKIIQQLVFEFPSRGYGWKSAGRGRPPSKDAIAIVVGGHLYGWDWQNGGSRKRQVQAGSRSENLAGQVFIPVGGVNHLKTFARIAKSSTALAGLRNNSTTLSRLPPRVAATRGGRRTDRRSRKPQRDYAPRLVAKR